MTRRWFLLLLLGILPSPGAAAEAPGHWIVVTAPAFREALQPLCAQRKAQGLRVTVVQTTDALGPKEILAGDARKLGDLVREKVRAVKGPRYVLLVGAAEPGKLDEPARKVLPPLRGTASRMKGKPSDHGYGDPGADLVPAAAVGRFPARTVAEARQMVAKTLASEDNKKPGAWKRQMTILAGAPGFGAVVDRMAETMAFERLARIDPSWHGRAIYHNPSSRFTLPDEELNRRALRYVEEGQAVTVYLGHSGPWGFASGRGRYLDRQDWARLNIRQGPGIFLTGGCFGCQYQGRGGEGYGLAGMRNPRGPAAVIGSLDECYSALVLLAADGFTSSFCAARPPRRLGESFLALQKAVAKAPISDALFAVLNLVDGNANISQADQRREHVEMFVLLGDPALRLPVLPVDLALTCTDAAAAGKTITVRGRVPARLAGARVHVTLDRPLDSTPADLLPVPEKPAADRARVLLANHQRANRFSLAERDVEVKDGAFAVRFELPAKLPWRSVTVRAYAATDRAEGLGVLVLPVKK